MRCSDLNYVIVSVSLLGSWGTGLPVSGEDSAYKDAYGCTVAHVVLSNSTLPPESRTLLR